MSETYSLILNSQNTTNIVDSTSLSAYQYNIRWDSILPRKYQNYSVTYQLKSANLQTSIITAAISVAGTLNVTAISGGSIVLGTQFLIGNILQTITAFVGGTGGTGTYTISPGGNAASATYYSLNTSLTQNIICSVNFGYNTTYEQNNSQSSKLGCVYPYIYPLSNTANISTFNYNCSVLDNGPVEIGYPSNQVITVKFLTMDGTTAFSQMPHYQLQLYFEPIKE
jgi:hypothetical protein